MRHFRAGAFRREHMPSTLRHFSPSEAQDRLEDIDLESLRKAGKRVILLDVDNTLLPWRSREIPETTHAWLKRARELGFDFCILSNTRNPERLDGLSKQMGIPYVRDKFKPSTRMFVMALQQFKASSNEAVMIGDQLLTDVLGANRSGIDAIWVRPMHHREFVGTRVISRTLERVLGVFLHRYFHVVEPETAAVAEKPGFFDHHVIKQFLKFCLVGASSTIIDMGLNYLLMFVIPVNGVPLGTALGQWMSAQWPALYGQVERASDPAFPVLQIPSTCVAILNGFYWNRQWTFKVKDPTEKSSQLRKYFVVVLLGLALGTVLSTTLNHLIPGHPKRSWAIAKAVATLVVAFWNFAGSRYYVFRDKSV